MATFVPPPGVAGGGDAGARAAGFKDYSDYQLAADRDKASSGSGINSSSFSGFSGVSNPVDTAKQLIAVNQQANQPAITSLQGQIDPLKQRYSDLLDSIKGQGTVAGNFAQQASSLDLGRRGLLPQSQEGQQALSNAMLPVTQATSGALAQTGLGEQQDINQINQAVAMLQSGNPQEAITNALGLYQQQQSLANQLQLGSIANQFKEFGLGGGVVNTTTGNLVGGGGGMGGGFSLSSPSDTTTTGGVNPLLSTLYASSAANSNPFGPGISNTPSSSNPVDLARQQLGLPAQQTNSSGFLTNPFNFGNIPLR